MYLKKIFLSEIKNLLSPPRQNYNIFILNLFGFQIIRYVLSYLKYNIFTKADLKTEEGRQLNDNGYLLIKNFFDTQELDQIKVFCKNVESGEKYKIKHYGKKKVHSYDFCSVENLEINNNDIRSLVLKKLNQSVFIDDIFQILKIKKKPLKNLSYERIVVDNDFNDEGDQDSEFHSDRFYPCIKIFIYLNDNKIRNGAFEYISKSHKFSFERLKHEYLYSIFIGGKNILKKIINMAGYEVKNNRVTFQKEKIGKIFGNDSIIACEAPANSLVICNNKGFHKRGRLEGGTERMHLRLNLYDLQVSEFKNKLLLFAKEFKTKKL